VKKTATEAELRAMVARGMNSIQIAEALGRGHGPIRHTLATLGIPMRQFCGRKKTEPAK
jgi:DNA-binding CsgD family transcriptional regulator